MFLQKLKRITPDKYLFLILVLVLIFFYPIFKGKIPFPGDLLVNFYEPYKAYFVLGYVPGSVPTKNQGADVVRHIFPWKHFAIESYKNGELPLWNPHNFSGNPQLANFQTGAFYPFNLIFIILPFLSAWTIYIVSAPILASFFMYLFLKELKISTLSSFFGGILFGFCSFMVVWMEYGNLGHSFLWLPLALLWIERFIKNSQYRYLIFIEITFMMSILAGFIQTSFYLIVITIFYFFSKTFMEKSLTLKKTYLFFSAIFFSFLLLLPQLLPTIELFSHSSRGNYTLSQIENLLNPWWYTVTSFVPNFFGNPASNNHWFYGTYIERVSYIGLIPLIFSLYALFNFRKRKEIIIFGILALFALVISTDLLVTKYFHRIPIPVISTAVPTRILSIFQFGAIVLAAIGFDYFRKNFNKKSLYLSIFLVFCVIVFCWIFTFFGAKYFNIDPINLAVAQKNLLIPTGMILTFILATYFWFKTKKTTLLLVILSIIILDLFYFFHRITPFSPKDFVYPKTPVIEYLLKNAGINRYWGYGSGYVESDFQTYDKTYSPEGVDPLHIGRYGELLETSKKGTITEDIPRMDARLAPGYGTTDLRQNKYRQKLLDLMGVKFILNKTESEAADYGTFPDNIYKLIYHDGSYQIYENKEVLPRAFLASEYIVLTDRQKIVDKIFDSSFDLKKTLILEEDPKMEFVQDKDASVKIDRYGNNNVLMSTSSKTNMLLFLSDTHSPEWKARVDGKETELYRANFAFRAVSVPAGNHSVEFYYWGESFYNGLKISLISFLVLIISYLVLRKYEKKK